MDGRVLIIEESQERKPSAIMREARFDSLAKHLQKMAFLENRRRHWLILLSTSSFRMRCDRKEGYGMIKDLWRLFSVRFRFSLGQYLP